MANLALGNGGVIPEHCVTIFARRKLNLAKIDMIPKEWVCCRDLVRFGLPCQDELRGKDGMDGVLTMTYFIIHAKRSTSQ